MGFNTTILILNDGLDELQKHPQEFVDRLVEQIQRGEEGDIPVGNFCNPVHVMKTAHADIPRIYVTHGNSIIDIDETPRKGIDKFWDTYTKWALRVIRDRRKEKKEEK